MQLDGDYMERVYAGVLGKIIGVYLGRPFEGWEHERILAELGEIDYYVHDQLGVPLVVTDDDIAGTFTFLRALTDYPRGGALTPEQVGQTWLNYIVEGRAILWWGGMGNSTEHTAYLRLKSGIPAPRSGAIATNGKVVAEQIGAQIFADGWGMVAPGDPERAADLARRAASVSHDGEALYAAQVVAAIEAGAFVERELGRLLALAVRTIPPDSLIYRLIADLREWSAQEPDWRATRARIAKRYGYDRYGGNCHVVPNHALIIHALLHGEDDFQRSLKIVTTCGWDTDCNAGNVGCILGIKNGLNTLTSGPDWRGPVADRLYLSTADGGRCITDAATEALHVVNAGRLLVGQSPLAPKGGARYHFELPGSVQGFQVDHTDDSSLLRIENVVGHSTEGTRSLALRFEGLACGDAACAVVATFITPDNATMAGYGLLASPTLYAGQIVRAAVEADLANQAPVTSRLIARYYGAGDSLVRIDGPRAELAPGQRHTFNWTMPDMGGQPIVEIGLELLSHSPAVGCVYLDQMGWDGTPALTLGRPREGGTMWRRAWVDTTDQQNQEGGEPYRVIQNEGMGLLIQGTRGWIDYQVSAAFTPHMVRACGLGVRVQGLRRFYALLLTEDGRLELVKALDGMRVLSSCAFRWELDRTYTLSLEVRGDQMRGHVDGKLELEAVDSVNMLEGGGVALLCDTGRVDIGAVHIGAVQPVAAG